MGQCFPCDNFTSQIHPINFYYNSYGISFIWYVSQRLDVAESVRYLYTTLLTITVCLGNINRSAIAHWVLHSKQAGIPETAQPLVIASCGTCGYHVGEGADRNMVAAARSAGYDMSDHVASQLKASDGETYEYV